MSSSTPIRPVSHVTLISMDGAAFPVSIKGARQSRVIRDSRLVVEHCLEGGKVPLLEVHSSVAPKLVEWLEGHRDDEINEALEDSGLPLAPSYTMSRWDAGFFEGLDLNTLLSLTAASNYLEIYLLLQLCCMILAESIRGKSVEEIRDMLRIENDWDEGEEERIRAENAWATDSIDHDYV